MWQPNFSLLVPPSDRCSKAEFWCINDPIEAGAAYIIRNYQKKLLRARGKKLPLSSILFAEMIVAWLGMVAAIFEMQI